MMPNSSMYVTVKRVNPDRLRCPVKDCQEEGKEENRVETPVISGLGPIVVYLCDTHAGELAAKFLDMNAIAGVVYWEKQEEVERKCAVHVCTDLVTPPMGSVVIPGLGGIPPLHLYLCRLCYKVFAERLQNMREQPVPLPGPIEPPARPGEAGAITAFMGWLTTREQVSGPFSRNENPTQAAQLIRQFIDMQGWSDPPEGWHHSIKAFEDEREALGRAHMDNYRRTHKEELPY